MKPIRAPLASTVLLLLLTFASLIAVEVLVAWVYDVSVELQRVTPEGR